MVPDRKWASGAVAETTNQRMELTAVLEALQTVAPEADGTIEVISDSSYVVTCFTDRWWVGWINRNWRTSSKKVVANRDLWEPLIELYRSFTHEITFKWVKGHSGDHWNEVADRLASQAAVTQKEQTGIGMPEVL